jgi:hypothetical protein
LNIFQRLVAVSQNGIGRPRGYLSLYHRRRTHDKMGLRDFLRQLKDRRGERSRARSETGPIGEQSEVEPVALRPTGSAPNFRIGGPTPGPSAARIQDSNGTKPFDSQQIRLTVLFPATQIFPPLLLNSSLIPLKNKPRSHHVSPIRHQICTLLPRLYKKSSPQPLTIRTPTVCGDLLPRTSV